MRLVLSAVLAALVLVPARAAEPAPELAQMKKDLFYLASDELQGRGVETKGLVLAGDYIAKTFKDAGLKPGGPNGSYFQPFTFPVGAPVLGTPNALKLAGPDGKEFDLKYGTEFVPTGMTGAGKKSGGLVFVGYGINAPKLKYNDYADIDVKGKFVVFLRKTPRPDNMEKPFDPDPNSALPALGFKVTTAIINGAAGVIIVNDVTYGKAGDALVEFSYRAGPQVAIPVLQIKRAVLDKLLDANEKKLADIEKAIDDDLKPQSFELKGWIAASEVTVTTPSITARNVIAVAEGAGPLADETVVVGAHYDHVGMGEPGSLLGAAGKGKIHNGADDNASGTTGLMEMARRFGAMKNRIGRRVVFIAFSAEERGLFGSIHYCKEPTFPLDKTVFMLNMDMIGRVTEVAEDAALAKVNGVAALAGIHGPVLKAVKDRVVLYGTGTATGMDQLVDGVNQKFDFKLIKVPGGEGPSDHDSYYRKKIPVLFFFTGTHRDYHRPTDTADKINLPGLKKVVDMGEVFVTHYATATERPKFQATQGGWSDPTQERAAPAVRPRPAAKLGIMPGNYEAKEGGVLVEDVSPGGAAEKSGLKAKDIIIEIAGKPVKEIQTYMTIMAGLRPGQEIEVIVIRNDKKVTVKVTPQ